MIYDVQVKSLARSYRSLNTKWVRGIKASSLTEATRLAKERHPNLGLTPTTASLAWYVWPQPKN